MSRLLKVIDSISEYSGRGASWLCVALVLVLTYETTARYVFNAPTIWAHVTAMMLFGSIGMLGLAYTHLHDGHVRVDLIYTILPPRGKAIIDVILALIVLFPLLYVLTWMSGFWVVRALEGHEVMKQSIWYPPASPFRIMILVALLLFSFQSIARFTRDLHVLIRGKPYD